MPSVTGKVNHETRFDQASDSCIAVFSALFNLYGKLWAREHSESPSSEFNAFTCNYSSEVVRRIVNRARQEKALGNNFPPTLGELDAWATMPTDLEFIEIGARVMAGSFNCDIEKWLVTRCKYNLRRTNEDQFHKKLKKFYWEAVILNREGKLFSEESEILALPRNSEINLNDKIRENFKPDPKTRFSVMVKIDRMKRAQKKQPKVIG